MMSHLPATANNSSGWSVERTEGLHCCSPSLTVLGEPSALPMAHRSPQFSFRYPLAGECRWAVALGALHPLNALCWGVEKSSELQFFPVQGGRVAQAREWPMAKAPSCLQAGWELSAWVDSRRVYSTQHKGHSHTPVFTHFALLHLLFYPLLGHPSYISPGSCSKQGFKSRQSPRTWKAFPDKPQRNRKSNKSAPPFGKHLWEAGEERPGGCAAAQGMLQEEPWDRASRRGAGQQHEKQTERGSGLSVHRQDPTSSPELNSC